MAKLIKWIFFFIWFITIWNVVLYLFFKFKYFTSVLFLHALELRIWLLECNDKQERVSLTEGPTLSRKQMLNKFSIITFVPLYGTILKAVCKTFQQPEELELRPTPHKRTWEMGSYQTYTILMFFLCRTYILLL